MMEKQGQALPKIRSSVMSPVTYQSHIARLYK